MDSKLLEKRDTKAKSLLKQYAPVWLTDERVIPEDDAVVFNIMFQHNLYGWVNRRYRYDGFNNVLYYRGQVTITEDKTLMTQENQPYVDTTIADITNSYGG